jgi:hypothetical protein
VGKKVQELTADLGVAGIIEGKLEGGGSTEDRASTARFRGRRWCSDDRSAERQRIIGQGASAWRCGADDALGEGGEGWNFGSIRNRTAAGSEIAGAAFWAARTREEEEERVRKGQ